MFWGYFDESGTHGNPEVFSLSGYVAGEAQWNAFEKQWSATLASEHVSVFHMAPFSARPRRGEFEGWSDHRAERFIDRLLTIVETLPLCGVAAFLRRRDFDEIVLPVLSDGEERVYRNPYLVCLQSCMATMVEFALAPLPYSPPQPARIACVFDRNHEVGRAAVEHFWDLVDAKEWTGIFHLIAFAPKHLVIPLQAADLLAYETYRFARNAFLQPELPRRAKLTRLVRRGLGRFVHIDATTLTRIAKHIQERKSHSI